MDNIIRFNGGNNSTLLSALSIFILGSGKLQEIILEKRERALGIQKVILPLLTGLTFNTFPTGFHIWLKIPESVNATHLAAVLLSENIDVSKGNEFRVDNAVSDQFIRIALSAEKNISILQNTISQIVELCK